MLRRLQLVSVVAAVSVSVFLSVCLSLSLCVLLSLLCREQDNIARFNSVQFARINVVLSASASGPRDSN